MNSFLCKFSEFKVGSFGLFLTVKLQNIVALKL
jgi:hypothetical protein